MIKHKNIQTSGGIFTHHFIESLQQNRVGHPALKAETFTFPNYERVTEKELEATIGKAWEILVERWDVIEREFGALDISTLRRRWIIPLFRALGFNLKFNRADLVLEDDYRFPISHLGWASTSTVNIPIHTLLYTDENTLETKVKPGRGIKAMAPHDMLQRYLNLSEEHRWGLLTDGVYLRLLRDYTHTYTRGYTEFDLQGIFSTRDFSSFRAMFRLLHASRFIRTDGEEGSPIDALYEDALSMGVAVGKDLRENVQKAIEDLGNGFLRSTPGLFDSLNARDDGSQAMYHEILVTIYRILFLLFAEQRGMLPGRGSVYMEEFSLTAFRTLAEQPAGDDSNVDLWEKLKTTFAMVEHGVDELEIFPYNGALFSQRRTPILTPPNNGESPRCRNDALLRTIKHLTTVEKDKVLQRISYSDLSVEEIGSIYESLLEITPRISTEAMVVEDREIPPHTFFLDLRGLGRKTTGSYYTPPSLVNELIKSALIPVMMDRLEGAVPGYESEMVEALKEEESLLAEEALLKIKVVDPACGSGAFLIAANNTLGLELARIRSASLFPPEKAIRHARRDVLAYCIHGVDLNPMAVELCKVSLWINAAVEDAPLNFLDHHIQCGNSLVGATPELVRAGIPNKAYNAVTGDDKALATSLKRQNRQELKGQQSLNFKVTLIKDQQALKNWLKNSQLAESEPAVAEKAFFDYQISEENWQQRLPYDLWTAAFFAPIQPDRPIPTTNDVRQALNNPESVSKELRMLTKQFAEKYRFFHWHLAFPEVFDAQGQGGFDIVLGNPPWEMINLVEKEFFAGKDDSIINARTGAMRKRLIEDLRISNQKLYAEYLQTLRDSETLAKYLRNSNAFPLTSSGRINLYSVFAGRVRYLLSELGRSGIIVPSGIATDYSNRDFFADLIEKYQLVSMYDFENRKGLFPEVHRSYKFSLFTLRGVEEKKQEYGEFGFFLQDVDDLQDFEKTFFLTSKDFKLLNPNTRTCPIFRSRADADLTRKLYQQAPVLINEETGENPWGISFKQGLFNMTSDSHIFRTREELEAMGFNQKGNLYIKNGATYLPLYEAKMFWFYDHRFGTYDGISDRSDTHLNPINSRHPDCLSLPWYWVNKKEVIVKAGEDYSPFHLCFRDITNTTNERTGIFAIIPFTAVGNNAPIVNFDHNPKEKVMFIVAHFSSFVWDYCVRKKIGGTHLNFYLLKQLPCFTPSIINTRINDFLLPRSLELIYTSYDLDDFGDYINRNKPTIQISTPFTWEDSRRFNYKCDLDAFFGHLYNLTQDEFAYVLDTFPIVKRKDEAEFGYYRTKSVILEKFTDMADDLVLDGVCIPLEERISVLNQPRKKTKQKAKKRETNNSPQLETKPDLSSEFMVSVDPVIEQPNVLSEVSEEQKEEKVSISDYTQYRCPICDKRVLGFYKDEHTREVHGGVDPGYIKMD